MASYPFFDSSTQFVQHNLVKKFFDFFLYDTGPCLIQK